MKTNRSIIFILIILLTFGLVACTRSASKPPTAPQDGEEVTSPTEGTQVVNVLGEKATQTAIAEMGGAKLPEEEPSEGEPVVEEVPVEESPAEEALVPEEVVEEVPVEADTPAEGSDEGGGEDEVVVPEEYNVPKNYTLQSGEFPYCIARRFNIDVTSLLNANGLGVNSSVYPGTTLVIPKDAGPYAAGPRELRPHPTDYTVQYDDTVYSIACYFGDVDPRAIEAVNALTGDYSISQGQVIKIP
jgi:LysM repeat protein